MTAFLCFATSDFPLDSPLQSGNDRTLPSAASRTGSTDLTSTAFAEPSQPRRASKPPIEEHGKVFKFFVKSPICTGSGYRKFLRHKTPVLTGLLK
jgi:hypothetical protein